MNVSTSLPMTVEISRRHLIGLIVAAAALAAAITWLLVTFAFDSGTTLTPESGSRPSAVTPAATPSTGYPPNYRGMP